MKKLLVIALGSSLMLASCDPVSQDQLPEAPPINLSESLTFDKVNSWVIEDGARIDFGFKGDAVSNSLYITYEEGIALDLEKKGVMLQYDIGSDSFNKLSYQPLFQTNSSSRIHLFGDRLIEMTSVSTRVHTLPMDFSTPPTITRHNKRFSKFGSAVHNDYIYVFGGEVATGPDRDPKGITDKVQRYNLSTTSFEEITSLPTPKMWAAGERIENKFYMFGGQSDLRETDAQSSIFSYDFSTQKIESFELPNAVHETFTAPYKNGIFVAGRLNYFLDGSVSSWPIFFGYFDTTNNTFTQIETDLPNSGEETIFNITIIGDKLYVIHGTPVEYDPSTGAIKQPNTATYSIFEAKIDF